MSRHEVIYAEAGHAWRRTFDLPDGATVSELRALVQERCGDWPDTARSPAMLAVFGREVDGGEVLREGDRLELLRALPTDPKRARRERAGQVPR
ncbi:MAG: RnfH family protein [Lysobacteraceae bacterium]|jgi:putative ubiquitin-RnfH superfamily antitoxin RatB of RatAB toxin-antitoxin module|nr:RnfH family protein [Xanthomonadaceae bacterium]MCZ8317302.1 RnfH family protein [Silanimonas sp.]